MKHESKTCLPSHGVAHAESTTTTSRSQGRITPGLSRSLRNPELGPKTDSGSGSGSGPELRKLGFTLVEIMVVVIVLAILAATIIPQFTTTTHDARVGTAKATISRLENALERFFIHMDRYPTTAEGLQVLVSPPSSTGNADRWRGPYVKELVPDPWGNSYMYRSPGVHGSTTYDLWSRGADGKDGGDGKGEDITNWRKEAS